MSISSEPSKGGSTRRSIQKRNTGVLNDYDLMEDHQEPHNFQKTSAGKEEIDLEGMEDPFGDSDWATIERKQKMASPFCGFDSYRMKSYIFKSNDDLRQELLAMQLIVRVQKIFQEANLSLYLRPYEIVITSHNSGFLECVPDTISIDGLKKAMKPGWKMVDFFDRYFEFRREEAVKNFTESLAGYSFICYLFAIKDRHNGNILLDREGHIVHIDFGFFLTNSPGGNNFTFETSPFKLTKEYVEVMGGVNSEMYEYFKSLMVKAFFEVRKHLDDIIGIIDIMFEHSQFPCFQRGNAYQEEIRARMSTKYNQSQGTNEYEELVEKLCNSSHGNWRTNQYDTFQKLTNGIHP